MLETVSFLGQERERKIIKSIDYHFLGVIVYAGTRTHTQEKKNCLTEDDDILEFFRSNEVLPFRNGPNEYDFLPYRTPEDRVEENRTTLLEDYTKSRLEKAYQRRAELVDDVSDDELDEEDLDLRIPGDFNKENKMIRDYCAKHIDFWLERSDKSKYPVWLVVTQEDQAESWETEEAGRDFWSNSPTLELVGFEDFNKSILFKEGLKRSNMWNDPKWRWNC